jgi:hypothetical protein
MSQVRLRRMPTLAANPGGNDSLFPANEVLTSDRSTAELELDTGRAFAHPPSGGLPWSNLTTVVVKRLSI